MLLDRIYDACPPAHQAKQALLAAVFYILLLCSCRQLCYHLPANRSVLHLPAVFLIGLCYRQCNPLQLPGGSSNASHGGQHPYYAGRSPLGSPRGVPGGCSSSSTHGCSHLHPPEDLQPHLESLGVLETSVGSKAEVMTRMHT